MINYIMVFVCSNRMQKNRQKLSKAQIEKKRKHNAFKMRMRRQVEKEQILKGNYMIVII